MNVRDHLISAMSSLELPVRLQGSYADDEVLPETFLTYFISESPDASFYDNNPTRAHTYITLILYSKKMSLITILPDQIHSLLKTSGFQREGRGRDFSYENEHYGWLMNIIHSERNT